MIGSSAKLEYDPNSAGWTVHVLFVSNDVITVAGNDVYGYIANSYRIYGHSIRESEHPRLFNILNVTQRYLAVKDDPLLDYLPESWILYLSNVTNGLHEPSFDIKVDVPIV